MLAAALALVTGAPAPSGLLSTDAERTALPEAPRAALRAAAACLRDRPLNLAEARLDAATLRAMSDPPEGEPLLRWVRERLGRPIDLPDFLLFLDDLCAHPEVSGPLALPASRGRAWGVLLHPDDVFPRRGRGPRRYGAYGDLPLDDPPPQLELEPARDDEPPGPRWTARFQQPMTDEGKLEELIAVNPRFGRAMRSLFVQLKAQGAFTWIEAAVRPRERGFLIYGSWFVSRAASPKQLARRIRTLERYEADWGLEVPIRWRHPDGYEATVEAARAMADTYGVDYATPRGARRSSHYGGRAVDLVAVDLPRRLELEAPDGATRVFDLSDPSAPRDLSLTPALVRWIERHFGVAKLRRDYPHWSDRG